MSFPQSSHPIPNKSRVRDSLRSFTDDFGIPDGLIANLAGEQTGDQTEFLWQIWWSNIWLHHMEKGCKNQNHHVEQEIGILKQRWKDRMACKSVST